MPCQCESLATHFHKKDLEYVYYSPFCFDFVVEIIYLIYLMTELGVRAKTNFHFNFCDFYGQENMLNLNQFDGFWGIGTV